MWLELRFADADRARTEDRPAVTETFGTVFGSFPSMLVRADASVLHPEDAEEGFVYWIAAVDQAAKNEPENGIAYSVSASWSGGDPVHAAAFIRYTRIDQLASVAPGPQGPEAPRRSRQPPVDGFRSSR